ncbi:hypothetical protein OPIT5_03075 [Opitutaceae bacterium TAV5]|nr:hypothetical protein OPIT5_03075 [Opitutaceae bacterium TAV5]
MLFPGLAALALTARTWTDTQGRTVEAGFVSATETTVTIRRDDGQLFRLELERLSWPDRDWVAAQAAPKPAWAKDPGEGMPGRTIDPVREINPLLGLELFADDNLWDDEPGAVAARLRLPEEGRTRLFESYRVYPSRPLTMLGAQAYTLSLHAGEGRIADVTIVFANRGDYPAFVGERAGLVVVGKSSRREFDRALKADFEKISAALSARLGESSREFSGSASDRGGNRLSWLYGDTCFLLDYNEEQMVSLKIVPALRSAEPRLASEQLRKRLEAGITRRANGDVILDQVPMVSQDPKGYCVPATFERYLRYLGIPADMYELAMVADTSFGGGTTFSGMAWGISRYMRRQRQGRSLEKAPLKRLTPVALSSYIDDGYPVIWGLFSTEDFNRVSNEHTRARAGATDWAAWKKTVAATAKGFTGTRANAHACLLIGYNRATDEIAFTDSWGPDYAERWVPAEVAQKISQDEYWMISR